MDNETGIAIARQLSVLNRNLETLNKNHEALLQLQGAQLGSSEEDEWCHICGKRDCDC